MNKFEYNQIETIFRESDSPDEIFDALQSAIFKKISDINLYKILLGNPSLSRDELIMFTEKICGVFCTLKFDLYMWLASILESNYEDYKNIENSLDYYIKAFSIRPAENKSLISALDLYNYDIELPTNSNIIHFIETGIQSVDNKNEVYSKLANHYRKRGIAELFEKYKRLAAISSKGRSSNNIRL
ncbi:hypothetical protein ACFLS9_03680 [Bacteroidota bacterium]